MIIYFDTSSLVKLYIDEEGTEEVRKLAAMAKAVITSSLSYVEAKSAFARKNREGGFRKEEYLRIKKCFVNEWGGYFHIEVSKDIYKKAGEMVETHALKAYDAIHLASYLNFKNKIKTDTMFSSFDDKLNKVVKLEDIR